jgi:hypothetical protein
MTKIIATATTLGVLGFAALGVDRALDRLIEQALREAFAEAGDGVA